MRLNVAAVPLTGRKVETCAIDVVPPVSVFAKMLLRTSMPDSVFDVIVNAELKIEEFDPATVRKLLVDYLDRKKEYPESRKRIEIFRFLFQAGWYDAAEQELKKMVEQQHAHSGSVVAMDPRTGDVLAFANFPTYDPNEPPKGDDIKARENLALASPIEPGSVFKVITLSAALETTRLRREVRALRASQARPFSIDRIVGDGRAMREAKALLQKVATSRASTVACSMPTSSRARSRSSSSRSSPTTCFPTT